MRITFPYYGDLEMDIPDGNLLGVYEPRRVEQERPTAALVTEALRAPVGGGLGLGAMVGPGARVTLLVDDFTRPTPVAEMLPPVLAELHAAGVAPADTHILVAPGTHRAMSEQELAARLGPEVVDSYDVRQHHWRDEAALVPIGGPSSPLPVAVNRRLLESDLVLGLGQIAPHRIAGFSGGAKIVCPGVTGATHSTSEMHWLAARMPARDILGAVENPIREAVDEIGLEVGLRFVVDVVQDGEGHVVGVFAGNPIVAYRRGAALSRAIHGLDLPSLAGIVVIDSHPSDVDYWQAAKAVFAAEVAVRPGGIIILVTPCPEGVAAPHPSLLELGVRPVAELWQMVEEQEEDGGVEDIIGMAALTLTAWAVEERASGIMVSPGISARDKSKLGFAHADTPQEALEMAFRKAGKSARVAVIHHGAVALPIVPERAEEEATARERVPA